MTEVLKANWGEWAALALVALAVLHLIRRWLLKKKSGSSCCKKGCAFQPTDSKNSKK